MNSLFKDDPKPFVEHLDDLRRLLVHVLITCAICTAVAIPLCPWVIKVLMRPVALAGYDVDKFIVVFDIREGISAILSTIGWTGMVLSLPVVVALIVRFVFPGLHARERRWVTVLGISSIALFGLGFVAGYMVTMPMAVPALIGFVEWGGFHIPYQTASGLISLEIRLLIAFGLAFQLPVVLIVLGMMGLVDSDLLRRKRRHVVVGVFVLAMVLTPPDPITQVMMALPMMVLYEVCIVLIAVRERVIARS